MALSGNDDPEEFLMSMKSFKMKIEDSGTLSDISKLHYLCKILCDEALRQFDTLCAQVGSTTTTNLKRIIVGLGAYFFLLMRCFL